MTSRGRIKGHSYHAKPRPRTFDFHEALRIKRERRLTNVALAKLFGANVGSMSRALKVAAKELMAIEHQRIREQLTANKGETK
jgi:hypothetical protein